MLGLMSKMLAYLLLMGKPQITEHEHPVNAGVHKRRYRWSFGGIVLYSSGYMKLQSAYLVCPRMSKMDQNDESKLSAVYNADTLEMNTTSVT